MTAFSPNDIPSSVTTVEQLTVWCVSVLQNLYPQYFALQEGRVEQLAVVSAIVGANPLPSSPTPYLYYFSADLLLPLDADHQIYGNQWEASIELGTSIIPTFFKT